MNALQSSNPALHGAEQLLGARADSRATIDGVVRNTALLSGLTFLAGTFAYLMVPATQGVMIGSSIAAMIVGIGSAFYLARNPTQARLVAPVYAVVEGAFLGLITAALDGMLAASSVSTGLASTSLAFPAMVVTLACGGSVLALYQMGVLRPTERFRSVLMTMTMGVFAAYMLMFLLSFFGIQVPFLSLGSAMAGGTSALIGLGLNGAILVLASLSFVIDFGIVEDMVNRGASKDMEWYGAFTLLVTLAWVYYEALKLVFRIAMMMNSRD